MNGATLHGPHAPSRPATGTARRDPPPSQRRHEAESERSDDDTGHADAPWRAEFEGLKAMLAVQDMALRALVHSHPDPASVLDAWRRLRADTVASAYAAPNAGPNDAWLTDPVHGLAIEWLTELEIAATRHARPSRHDAWRMA